MTSVFPAAVCRAAGESSLSISGSAFSNHTIEPLMDSPNPYRASINNSPAREYELMPSPTTLDGLPLDQRYRMAAVKLTDALRFRPSFLLRDDRQRAAHARLHSVWFRFVRKAVIFAHLALAFLEFPTESGLRSPNGVPQSIELIICCVYGEWPHPPCAWVG